MRIAYVCYSDAGRLDGVGDKIASQVEAWASAGHEPMLYLLNPRSPEEGSDSLGGESFPFRNGAERPFATRRLYSAVRRDRPQLVYLRYDLFVPPPSALTRIAPTVVEINSNTRAELALRSHAAVLYGRLQEGPLLRRAAGAVCVTYELARAVSMRAPELPLAVIANGIDLARMAVLPPPTESGVRVVYLGNDVYWQGIDKLHELAEALPDWQFDLVGVPAEHSRGNVLCHGFLVREQYEPILARADVAVGTLALHRKQMDEACALKVRRYLAYGLPVILGHEDTDFADIDPWYLLSLPNTEANVREGVERIRSFATAVKGRRVDRSEVAGRLSVEVKEAARLAFLAGLSTPV